jgi:hypothetical protein
MDTDTDLLEPVSIGDFPDDLSLANALALTFAPKTFPVRWAQCSATADFFSDFFSGVPSAGGPACRTSLSYVLNELLENALKFASADYIHVACGLLDDHLAVLVANHIPPEAVPTVQATFSALLADDPFELLVQRVEQSADDPDAQGSGLGFLTMLTDYQADLSWRLSADPTQPGHVLLQALARLPIEG